MIKIEDKRHKQKADSTIALINIVFLMLIFFLIAGTISPPLDREISPIASSQEENSELAGSLGMRADGTLMNAGVVTTLDEFVAKIQADEESTDQTLRVLPDKDVTALELIDLLNKIKQTGVERITVITERVAE